jgi:hypothetical protein
LFQPDSSGFPEGLLGQPFYGWFICAERRGAKPV